MPDYEDPDWPSTATAEGQSLRFASGLGRAGRKGKVVAWISLAGLVLPIVVVTVVLVRAS